MYANNGVTGVTISYLTFDGNRYAFGTGGNGISCLMSQWSDQRNNFSMVDLDLSAGGNFTVTWLDFVNAPGTALHLTGSAGAGGNLSTVSFSNFGVGLCPNGTGYCTGIGPSGQSGAESGPQSATRFTAVYLSGGSQASGWAGAGAYYNNIQYAGTAGLSLDGYGQTVYGNLLFGNRYEISDGSGGGQITLWPGFFGNSAYASIAGNVVNGNNNWPNQHGGWAYTETLCPLVQTQAQSNGGMEVNGVGHRFYNNEVYQNSGGGMVFNLSPVTTGQVTVSSTNPWYSGDTPRYIESNAYGGITFYGTTDNSIQGVSLDDVLISSNAVYGVNFVNVSNYSSYTGFIQNGSCMQGNTTNVTYSGPNTPQYLYPSSYSSYHGAACPPQFVGLTPAPSNTPPWAW
jgi:hypothetical protein